MPTATAAKKRLSAGAGLVLGGILAVALVLRLWSIGHGLPFVYNVDEAEHFVPKALGMLDGGLDPGYYENPSGLTYLLLVLFTLPWPGLRTDPSTAFLVGRVVVALIGTVVVGLVYWAGRRLFAAPVGLVAAAVMAVAFLPVAYSKHALNDVVTLAPVTVGVVATVVAYERGHRLDWVLAGAAAGAATAVKYTAGVMLLGVAAAALLRAQQHRTALPASLLSLGLASGAFAGVFVLLNPFLVVNSTGALEQITGQSAQADTGKFGQVAANGWAYYAETLTWGLGWLPLVAAGIGAVLVVRRDWRLALLLLLPAVALFVYMGAQGRYFGRWLLPTYPVLCLLAGNAVIALARGFGSHRRTAAVLLTVGVCLQGFLSAIHVNLLLGRTDTRALASDAVQSTVPAGAPVVVEPFVPQEWRAALERPVWPLERPFQAYQQRLRADDINRYRAAGYCWVIVGSTQKERGIAEGLQSSRAYYQALDRASEQTITVSPYADGAQAVPFSFDASFLYYPRAYVRPGPVVEIHRLKDCSPP